MIKFIDLFAGIGGLRLGFEAVGGQCVFSSEIDLYAQSTYKLNFKENPAGDICQIPSKNIPKHDILLAGFPCQSFSVAGDRAGLKDKRGALFYEIIRILEAKQPKAFLLENVTGLCFLNKGAVFRFIQEELKRIGYNIHSQVLNTMHYGNLPQTRARVYIVGFLNQTNKRQISHFENDTALERKTPYNQAQKHEHSLMINLNNYDFTFPKKILLKKTIQEILLKEKQDEKFYYNRFSIFKILKQHIKTSDSIYQWRRSYVRENKSGVCPTLMAHMGTGGHNVPLIKDAYGIRKLTPRECARFQGFPDSFQFPNISDCHLYKQIGNSVSIPVVTRIAKNIMKVLIQKEITFTKKTYRKSKHLSRLINL